jgi:hypothetical protein
LTSEEFARAILRVFEGQSNRVTKEVLVAQKMRVMELCADVLNDEWDMAREAPEPAQDMVDAYVVVLTYEGNGRFLKSLKWHLETHGYLSLAQCNAVVGPPRPEDVDELRHAGVEVPARSYEAHELVLAMRREARQRALAEVEKSEDNT